MIYDNRKVVRIHKWKNNNFITMFFENGDWIRIRPRVYNQIKDRL